MLNVVKKLLQQEHFSLLCAYFNACTSVRQLTWVVRPWTSFDILLKFETCNDFRLSFSPSCSERLVRCCPDILLWGSSELFEITETIDTRRSVDDGPSLTDTPSSVGATNVLTRFLPITDDLLDVGNTFSCELSCESNLDDLIDDLVDARCSPKYSPERSSSVTILPEISRPIVFLNLLSKLLCCKLKQKLPFHRRS